MKLKKFKLVGGKIVYQGIAEVKEGDAILEGDTNMSSLSAFILREQVKGLGKSNSSPEVSKEKLAEAFRRMHPEWTDDQVKIAVEGR